MLLPSTIFSSQLDEENGHQSSLPAFIFGQYLLEDREREPDPVETATGMLFDPNSPFVSELRTLLPNLTIGDEEAYSYSLRLPLFRFNSNGTPVSEYHPSYNFTPPPVLERIARYAFELNIRSSLHLFAWMVPYAMNLKSMGLSVDPWSRWIDLISAASENLERLVLRDCSSDTECLQGDRAYV